MDNIDAWLFKIVNQWCGNWYLDRIAGFEESNYLFKGGLLIAAYWWFWFAADKRQRTADRQTIIGALIGTVLALVVNRCMAVFLPFRVRPMYVPDIGYQPPSLNIKMNLEQWSSFPSDSSTFWLALSFGLFLLSRPLGIICMLYSIFWMCLTRLYLGIHYPSDLVAGGLLGVAVVWGTHALLAARGGASGRWILARLTVIERRYPQWFYAAAFLISFELTMTFDDVRALLHVAQFAVHVDGYPAVWKPVVLAVAGVAVLASGVVWLRSALHRRGTRAADGATP